MTAENHNCRNEPNPKNGHSSGPLTTFERGTWRRYVHVLPAAHDQHPCAARQAGQCTNSQELSKLQTIIVRVMRNFPDARDALVKAILEGEPAHSTTPTPNNVPWVPILPVTD
jgi:hypothetical protein